MFDIQSFTSFIWSDRNRLPCPINGDEDTIQSLKSDLVSFDEIGSLKYCTDNLDYDWELLRFRDNVEQDPDDWNLRFNKQWGHSRDIQKKG